MGILFNDKERYGCGSGIFFIDDKVFFPACKEHDIDYSEKTKTQKQADKDFLKNMLDIASTPWQYIRAYIYYGIVRFVGWIFWKH